MNLKRPAPLALALALYALDPTAFGLSRSVSASPQTFVTPKGEAQNVRFEQREGGTVHILYDLVASDPRAVFSVMLDASPDNGTTWGMRPRSVTGDTGDGVTAGVGKRIVWDSGKDVERVQIDRIRFRIVATAGPLKLETPPAPPTPAATSSGVLAVATTPAGAQVTIDGTPRGVTPLTLRDLTPGAHRVAVAKAGYLENSQTVDVVAGKEAKVDVALTADSRATQATGTSAPPAKKGGKGKLIAIGGGAVAAAAVAAVSGGGGGSTTSNPPNTAVNPTTTPTVANRDPVISSSTVTPSGALLVTSDVATFEVIASDPNGDQLTATWNFGDGTTASASISGGRATTTKAFSSIGSITSTVIVSDGRGGSASASYPAIDVLSLLNGLWTGRLGLSNCALSLGCYTIRIVLQNSRPDRTVVFGDFEDQLGRTSVVTGRMQGPRNLIFTITPASTSRGVENLSFNLTLSADQRTFTGTGAGLPVTIAR